jgi:hypothetical protein
MSLPCGLTLREGQVQYSTPYAAGHVAGSAAASRVRWPVGGWCEIGTMRTMAMNVRLTEEAERVLAALSEEDGVSKNEEINRAILDRGARLSHQKDVRALAREAITSYGPLLDRLAQ